MENDVCPRDGDSLGATHPCIRCDREPEEPCPFDRTDDAPDPLDMKETP